MEAMNPFNSKEFKEKILAKEGKQEASDDYELFDDIIEEKSDLKNIIVGAPSIPKKAATNMILDASAIAKNEKEKKAAEMELALNDIFTFKYASYGCNRS